MSIEEIAAFAKRKGFVFPSGEIYGSLSGFWDYGPLGTELKRNIERELWDFFVRSREDIVGIDGSIVTHPSVWKASGHLDSFTDPLVRCKRCGKRYRADKLIEDELGLRVDGVSPEKMERMIREKTLKCPECSGDLGSVRAFNLMFSTEVGPTGTRAYLRPETAQLIFTNFELVQRAARKKLPFGIAQLGKAFRNEISPRNFLMRSREFTQFEIEFFVHPEKMDECPCFGEVESLRVWVFSRRHQKGGEPERMTVGEAVDSGIFGSRWHAYWLGKFCEFFTRLGLDPDRLRLRQHLEEELSHYAEDTWDIEYRFPFGWREIHGCANRTDFDLKRHSEVSGKELAYFDQESGKRIVPYVIEPSQGVDRLFLALLFEAYTREEERTVLRLKPFLAPYVLAVFPLVKRDGLPEKAREIFSELSTCFPCFYDESGSIGRRYRRMDEIGTPFCVTVDGETLENGTVTLRERDSMEQKRVRIGDLKKVLSELIRGKSFSELP